METEKKMRVCVTGAGGFLASWLVNLLLSKGYMVHGTARDPSSDKNGHLKKLDKAAENLQLFKANLLDYDSLCAAIAGCDGVFHVASPVPSGSVPNPEVELLEPAINGTLNVLRASSEAKVKRVVFVSSSAAVALIPSWPKDRVMDENCWSDKEYCRASENWYCLSKTAAEREALEFGEKYGLNVVTLCPTLIFGPMLQPVMNASSMVLCKILTGGNETMENKIRVIVDVRDVAEALLLIYEKPETSGRYICTTHHVRTQELVDKLRSMYPNYNYPKKFTDVDEDMKMSSEKLRKLGWKSRTLEETLADTVTCFEEAGLLKKV